MADNVTTPAQGTGDTTPVIATDDVAGVHYQKFKLFDAAADSTIPLGVVPSASKTVQYTTAQAGAAIWTPAAGKRLVVTSYQIQAGGTTAGTVQVWFGASGDTTYSRGTDKAIFDGEFAPSATLKPGVVQTGVWAGAADDVLRCTDSAAISPLTVTVWGYEV